MPITQPQRSFRFWKVRTDDLMTQEELALRYEAVRNRVTEAALRAGRDPAEVTLLPVTKTHPAEVLEIAYQLGMREAGENRVQEILAKKAVLPEDLKFHLIGHLQKNKVRQIVGQVVLIHSVDSLELARLIDRESEKKGIISDILIEVNVAGEESKFGLEDRDSVLTLVQDAASLEHIRVKGLMTVAPYVPDPEDNREVFHTLHDLFIDIQKENIHNVSMSVLSMGMTNDYTVAVEEGATLVRVGTGIFGERAYTKTNL